MTVMKTGRKSRRKIGATTGENPDSLDTTTHQNIDTIK